MKCVVITSAYPPQTCGAGDYTEKLLTASNSSGWYLYHSRDWGLMSFFKHVRAINRFKTRHVNLQYPTVGYGWSLVPHLLCVYYSLFTCKQFCVTMHEQSKMTKRARMALNIFLLFANRLIFTSQFERQWAINVFARVAKRSAVIGICSNISSADLLKTPSERNIDIIYFGIFRINKGIDKFIDVVSMAKQKRTSLNVCLMGKFMDEQRGYFNVVKQKCKEQGIEILLDKSEDEVMQILNDAKIAFLPFPDGVAQKRGSLLAVMANGAVVVSSVGAHTTPQLEHSIIVSPEDNVECAELLVDSLCNAELLEQKQKDMKEYLDHNVPKSWEDVVAQYTAFLES